MQLFGNENKNSFRKTQLEKNDKLRQNNITQI